MAVFEFVALTCIRPSEIDGDEVYIEYNGVKVFPGADRNFRSFKKGSMVLNTDARLDRAALQSMAGDDTTPLNEIVGGEALARHDIPGAGLVVRVMEYDSFSADDVLGSVLVPFRLDEGLQTRRLEGDGSHYILSYLIQAGPA